MKYKIEKIKACDEIAVKDEKDNWSTRLTDEKIKYVCYYENPNRITDTSGSDLVLGGNKWIRINSADSKLQALEIIEKHYKQLEIVLEEEIIEK